jgi:predicted RNA-binding protein
MFFDKRKIFSDPKESRSERFSYRVKLKRVRFCKIPIEFRTLVPNLNFITNKKNWSLHLRGIAIIEIPESDYKLMSSACVNGVFI